MDGSRAKVGAIVILGAIIAVGLLIYLTQFGIGWRSKEFYIVFSDARGIQPGAPVRLAGVEIGKATAVELKQFPEYPSRHAAIRVRVRRNAIIHKNDRYIIGSGLLIADRFIKIEWAKKPGEPVKDGDVVPGSTEPELGELVPRASEIMDKLNKIATDLETLTGSISLRENIVKMVRNLNATSRQAARLAERMARIADESSGNIQTMASNLAAVSEDLKATAAHVRAVVAESPVPEDVTKMAANLRQASEDAAQMVESLKDLTTDEKVQQDLRTTVGNLREASTSAKAAAEHGENILRRVDTSVQSISQIQTSTDLMTQYAPDLSRWRTDVNVSLWSEKHPESRYILGWRDIGESNKLNLQQARRLREGEWLRAGLIASKLGLGYDRVLNSRWDLTAELYDPNDLTLDVKGFYRRRTDENWRLLVGIDKLFKDNDFVVGASVRY